MLGALPESAAGQAEVLELLLEHLPQRFPEHYRRSDGEIANLVTGERFDLAAWRAAPLELAGRLVQEDLCLMQRGEPPIGWWPRSCAFRRIGGSPTSSAGRSR